MQDLRNLILTIIISLSILTAWQVFFEAPRQEKATQEQLLRQKQVNELKAKQATTSAKTEPENSSGLQPRNDVISTTSNQRIKIDGTRLHGSISLVGARIDDLTLAGYHEQLDKKSPEVVLLSPPQSSAVYFTKFNWISPDNSVNLPDPYTVWQADNSNALTTDNPVTLSWKNPQGIHFYITIALDDHYMFTITQRVENKGNNNISLLPYGMISRTWAPHPGSSYILHEGALGVIDGVLNEVTYDDLKEEKTTNYTNTTGWIGITDKYWLTTLIPDQKNHFNANFTYTLTNGQDRYQVDYIGQPVTIAAGSTNTTTSHLFAGAKEIDLLEQYGEQLGVPLFDRAIDFGYLYFLTKPIFGALKYFYALLENFGLAILLLTISIKFLLFPLANKSYRSFAKMRKLTPLMAEIRGKYKDDKMRQNQEIMALYKREKVNPLSGCLPLLLQIPVFFALYKVLYVTIEMRHAPFYGWIKDLSAPDPTTIFNLFGLIPWDPSVISQHLIVGVLPILMGITMYIQQQLNPPPADPVQAKVMQILPWFFIFIFASFPAGLVLYWVWNNILSIIQQWVITRTTLQEGNGSGSNKKALANG